MKNKESIYDEQISPLMTQILKICQEHELPMFASFQFCDDGFCTSALDTGHPVIKHYQALAQCGQNGGVNVDKYMFWVASEVRKEGHGHGSLVLSQMGVPSVP